LGVRDSTITNDVNVPLRIGNGDVVVFESLPDPEKDSAFDIRNTVVGIIDPDA
jgi:hypothetical protein